VSELDAALEHVTEGIALCRMGALLGRLIAAQREEQTAAREVPFNYLARLLRAFDQAHPTPHPRPGAAAAVPGLPEPLTARELEVLRLLAAGLSNQRIAHGSWSPSPPSKSTSATSSASSARATAQRPSPAPGNWA